jgi:MFS family permease
MQKQSSPEPDAAEPAPAPPAAAWRGTLMPFTVPAFRLQWPGDLMTAVAAEMEIVILGWYVLSETGSVLLLTLFGALHFFGTLAAPLLGVVGDRIGLRPLLTLMRSAYVAIALTMAALALSGRVTPLLVFVLAALMALVRASDISVRTGLVARMMPPGLLTGAVGLSRMTGDVARIIGALFGASLFALFGLGAASVAIVLLYLAGLLLTMAAGAIAGKPAAQPQPAARRRSPWRELAAGVGYVWRKPELNAGVWLAVLANLTAFPLTGGLMPYIARDVFGLEKTGLGFLIASFAFGAMLGSLTVGIVGSRLRLGRQMLIASVCWHIALLVFVHAPNAALGSACLVAAGFAQSISMVSLAAMLLRASEPDFHGRVMGVRMLATYSLPIGLVVLGALIERLGFAMAASLWQGLGIAVTLAIGLGWRGAVWSDAAVANRR